MIKKFLFTLILNPYSFIFTINAERIEYVVAHYNENLDWLSAYAHETHLYHKGDLNAPPISVAAWTKLPNVGREGHTYLFHIINNYHNLADITFFLQGRIEDHTRGITLDALLTEIRRSGISFFGEYLHPKQGCLDYENFLNFWKKIFKIPIPRNIKFYSGACFGVRKELIYNHPIAFYRRLLQVLDKKICPKEGYHIERMWYFIFNPVAAIGY